MPASESSPGGPDRAPKKLRGGSAHWKATGHLRPYVGVLDEALWYLHIAAAALPFALLSGYAPETRDFPQCRPLFLSDMLNQLTLLPVRTGALD